jgi:uncharacterized protein (DUF2267 family)
LCARRRGLLPSASVEYDEFMKRVAERAGVSTDEAAAGTRAVLTTLAERIGLKEARDTASQLPKELWGALDFDERTDQWGEGQFDAGEFVRRVAVRLGWDEARARDLTRAVFMTLREAVSEGELSDWQYDLSTDYVALAARPAEVGGAARTTPPDSPHRGEIAVGAADFVRRVAERTGLDEGRARIATAAVLETLGERIAGGEAEDLAQQLPESIAEPLLRAGGDAQPISAEEFVRRVAEREGELQTLAREHARAVLTTLREAVTADEWDDTVSELSREYEELLA